MLLFIKLSDNSVQRINLHHRALVGLFVVEIEGIEVSVCREHRTFSCANPSEVELRERLDDTPEHLCADIALARVGVVGDILRAQAAYPLEVRF